jgi:hypothetical protein
MSEPYYDINDDWSLVYASFQSEYGIRLSKELSGMTWREFAYYLGGISGKSPLGQIVAIRAENDPEKLKDFTPEEKKIRNEYRRKKAKVMPKKKASDALEGFKQAFIQMSTTIKDDEKTEM